MAATWCLTSVPVEADIWKIDGNTVYFFNQLRGLQVLDMTDPADPRLTASLRLPAVGRISICCRVPQWPGRSSC